MCTKYEIDLTTDNAAQLRSALSEYVAKGRKATSERPGQTPQTGVSATRKREELQQIRKWAERNGLGPHSRGRISQPILNAYAKAQQQ